GEVASDYDDIAPLYHKLGASLFVADYRGYGRSNGSPSFASMAADAHKVLDYVRALVGKRQDRGELFVMGRSLGSHSAIELAWCCAAGLRGLILESGFAHVSRLLKYHVPPEAAPKLEAFEKGIEARVKAMKLPVLVVHGEEDTLVPQQHAYRFYENVGSADKTLLTIPGAGHNDIMIVGMREYFAAIEKFVKRLSG
ncbi:MAG TPA: alpha/beta hydrolase, partial [Dehalococcoidia bacterium]|nr:alpha/beta hydrolase [Dehalococcoidia bacterium]